MSGLRASAKRAAAARGFTLVEIAVTLFIVTLLLGAVMIPLQTQVESRKIDETRQILDRAREALLGYAASFGYFPCPADGASNGVEPAGVDHIAGTCPSYSGFLPAALLGFSPVDEQGYALDAWGASAPNRIRYAISAETVGGVTLPFTRSGGMSAAGVATVGGNSDLIHICPDGATVTPGMNCGAGVRPLASNVVALVWSLGQNALTGGTSVHERENPNPNSALGADRIFVNRIRVTSGANEFDDQLAWISGFVVVTRLIASGQLP